LVPLAPSGAPGVSSRGSIGIQSSLRGIAAEPAG
jgi:hypothetical protein